LEVFVGGLITDTSYHPYPLSPCSYAHSEHSHIDAFWCRLFTHYTVSVKALHIGGVNWPHHKSWEDRQKKDIKQDF